ncbi:uncharacterized protein LOC132628499 [Lycium barbarum]|uniref:uncharacterized protein LOC132628499 n=1 Tax=Lycium barbarum TaxID=112863 RepID=UPI00293F3A58|nr:uncharacterized protein LOC132628499 [Lycium barbarum]
MATSPQPGGDQAATSEAPTSTEAAAAVPASLTPAPRSDNLDDNARFTSRLGEIEATIFQLRSELDSVKADAVKMAERHRLLESGNAKDKEKLRVVERKMKARARISDELKRKFEEVAEANDVIRVELESANQIQRVLLVERSELAAKLEKAEADLEESLKYMESAEARTTILVEYERWKSRRATLKQAQKRLGDLQARILEAKAIEEEAKKALNAESENSERTVSENSGSNRPGRSGPARAFIFFCFLTCGKSKCKNLLYMK